MTRRRNPVQATDENPGLPRSTILFCLLLCLIWAVWSEAIRATKAEQLVQRMHSETAAQYNRPHPKD